MLDESVIEQFRGVFYVNFDDAEDVVIAHAARLSIATVFLYQSRVIQRSKPQEMLRQGAVRPDNVGL
jgi:hypothetical protein